MKKQMRDLMKKITPRQRKPKEVQRGMVPGAAELGADPEQFDPPATRYTEEYAAFVESMQERAQAEADQTLN